MFAIFSMDGAGGTKLQLQCGAESTRGYFNCIEATHHYAIQIGDRVAIRIPGI
jgi:hypothetical protein